MILFRFQIITASCERSLIDICCCSSHVYNTSEDVQYKSGVVIQMGHTGSAGETLYQCKQVIRKKSAGHIRIAHLHLY